jgi:hypothetical protein
MSVSTNLHLPYLAPGQAQKHVTVNESLRRLDALVQLCAASATTAAQPPSPADGAVYILPAGKTGAQWGGFADGALAYYRDGTWEEIAPRTGWLAFAADTDRLLVRSGSAWLQLPSIHETGTIAPTITFAAPGDLSGAYGVQQGSWTRIGDLVYFEFIVSRTLTYATASGELQLGGLPYPPAFTCGAMLASTGAGIVQGAGYTQIEGRVTAGASHASIIQLGSNLSGAVVAAANIASGTTLSVRMSGVYRKA